MRVRTIFRLAIVPITISFPVLGLGQPVAVADSSVPSFGHVFLLIGENKSLFQLNSSNAPYIMKTLKPAGAWFTDYSDVTKGSLADYVALTSGQFAPCQPKGPCGQFDVPSIFSQLGDGNWKDWNESMPSNCYRSSTGTTDALNAYKVGHNPVLYYSGLPCSTYDVPAGTTGPDDMSYFNNDLKSGDVPAFNLVNPNLCEDSYHSCNKANIITEYDNFLKKEIPLIEASPAFGSDGVIFVTYDEGYEPTANPNTMMIVLGPQVQAGTYTDAYNHYSAFATFEKGLGLDCLANACTADTLPVFGGSSPPPPPPPSGCASTPTGTTEYSGNLSLESDQSGWTGPYNSGSKLSRVEPSGGSYDGSWALQVGIKSGSGQAGVTNANPVWVSSTTKGTTYTAAGEVSASVAGKKVSLSLVEKTPAGKTVATHTSTVTLGDTDWHPVSVKATAAAAGDVLHYSLHAALSSTSQNFLADCLSLQAPTG